MYVVATLITYISDDHMMIYMLIKSHWRIDQLLRATPLSQLQLAGSLQAQNERLRRQTRLQNNTDTDIETQTVRLITERCVKCG